MAEIANQRNTNEVSKGDRPFQYESEVELTGLVDTLEVDF
jgi:hypothetical protein